MGIRQIPNFKYQVRNPTCPAATTQTFKRFPLSPGERVRVRDKLVLPLTASPSFPSVKETLPHQTTKSHKPRLFAQKSLRASGFLHSFPAQRLNWASKLGNYTPTVNGFFGNFP